MPNKTAPTRPTIGHKTEYLVVVNVCASCGHLIDETVGCDWECDDDFEDLSRRTYIKAQYHRTDELLGYEIVVPMDTNDAG